MKRTRTSPRKSLDEGARAKRAKHSDVKREEGSESDSASLPSSGDDFNEKNLEKSEEQEDEDLELMDAVKDEDEGIPMDLAEAEEEERPKKAKSKGKGSAKGKGRSQGDAIDIEDLDTKALAKNGEVMIHTRSRHKFSSQDTIDLRSSLLNWYDKVQRVMPWRKPSPKFLESLGAEGEAMAKEWEARTIDHGYAVLVSEIMLQQTQVATVISYFNKWVKEFPSFAALAAAPLERVNELWAGLGYYRRARFLRECAVAVVEKHKGLLPKTAAGLVDLPGVGQYTAGAVASIVFGEVTPVVDGNVVRVLSRLRAIGADSKQPSIVRMLWDLAREIVEPQRPGDFNQAMMELGATVCTPKDPQCGKCPVRSQCLAHKEVTELRSSQPPILAEGEKQCDICTSAERTMSVTKYPIVPKKKAPRDMDTLLAIVERNGNGSEAEYLFVQRPKTGLLASFWEFPSKDLVEEEEVESYASRQKAMDEYLKAIGISIGPEDVQTLHVEYISVVKLSQTLVADKSLQWVKPEGMESLAMSKGMKKCFDLLNKDKKGAKPKAAKGGDAAKAKKGKAEAPKMAKIDSFFKPKK